MLVLAGQVDVEGARAAIDAILLAGLVLVAAATATVATAMAALEPNTGVDVSGHT